MRSPRSPLMSGTTEPRRGRRFRDLRSVPILPSLVTLGNLFFGFLAMSKAADGVILQGADPVLTPAVLVLFEAAALLVFLAMIFDGLDGAVARMTNQITSFGSQLDSLADVVTFGVAPAFIAKMLVDFHARPDVGLLPSNAKLYWAAAAIYVLCAAMRLARYNVESSGEASDKREFVGLPSPAAAAVVCSMIAFFTTRADNMSIICRLILPAEMHDAVYDWMVVSMPLALVLLGLLMVSRLPFPHVVAALVGGRHSFPSLATLVVVVFIAAIDWQFAILVATLLYVAFGMLLGVLRLLTRGRMDPPDRPAPDDLPRDPRMAERLN